MIVNESAENYLETILVLSKQLPVVRSVDVANELGFKKSSVSVAMKNLREKNHITVTKAGFIYLSDRFRQSNRRNDLRTPSAHLLLSDETGSFRKNCRGRCLPHRARNQQREL